MSDLTVAALAEGKTQTLTIQGQKLLTWAVSEAGFEIADAHQVLVNDAIVPDSELEERTVQPGDVVLLVPMIQGGEK